MSRRYILLDRDGTIIVERHYLDDPDGVELIPGAAEGLAILRNAGFGLIVTTNQAAIGRGIITHGRLEEIHARMIGNLRAAGASLDGIYYCPHLPDDRCSCRKPGVGLVEQAARDHAFDPRESYMIGDKNIDIALGRAVGCPSILTRTGYGAEQENTTDADFVVDDLRAAAHLIVGRA